MDTSKGRPAGEPSGRQNTNRENTNREGRGDLYLLDCPCREVLDLVASKWSALIIGRLEEPHRFGQLRRAVPGITQKMLTQTLRRLEQDGLVHREVLGHMRPPQVEYSLTELGVSIAEPLAALRDWSEHHLPDVQAARHRFAAQLAEAEAER